MTHYTHRSHCVNGHPLWGRNVSILQKRSRGHTYHYRNCLTCRRMEIAVRYYTTGRGLRTHPEANVEWIARKVERRAQYELWPEEPMPEGLVWTGPRQVPPTKPTSTASSPSSTGCPPDAGSGPEGTAAAEGTASGTGASGNEAARSMPMRSPMKWWQVAVRSRGAGTAITPASSASASTRRA